MSAAHNDPYPWVTIDDEGKEFRVHSGRIDTTDPELTGWTFSPRSDAELDELGYSTGAAATLLSTLNTSSDPYPWVAIDENGEEFRTHTAHEDGIDSNGFEWSGWTYAPRTAEELEREGN